MTSFARDIKTVEIVDRYVYYSVNRKKPTTRTDNVNVTA